MLFYLCYTLLVNTTPRTKQTPGFTVMELIVVVVIVGVLAAVALPSYKIQMLKMKNQEAIRVLTAVWEAEKDYYRENGVYGNPNSLDVVIPQMKNFTNLQLSTSTVTACSGLSVAFRIHVDSIDSSYRLFILEDGRFLCRRLSAYPCTDNFCLQRGFQRLSE
ncbi:MAG: prepilin-type N-terminal cleavage/methylation domain-containing protein [Candidatus Omnitrophica bacterium]|nr:prepilin-type N-terminal cleavage/methylation domain-containing protein [Candidatus Omnitrophota bacterium]